MYSWAQVVVCVCIQHVVSITYCCKDLIWEYHKNCGSKVRFGLIDLSCSLSLMSSFLCLFFVSSLLCVATAGRMHTQFPLTNRSNTR